MLTKSILTSAMIVFAIALVASCGYTPPPEPDYPDSSSDAAEPDLAPPTNGGRSRDTADSSSTRDAASRTRPSVPRLWHYQTVGVGGSRGSPACGTTNPKAWTPQRGWLAMEPSLRAVRQAFGSGFDLGIDLHHPYGVWDSHYAFGNPPRRTGMIFEQRLMLLERCPQAQLRSNLDPLHSLLDKYGFTFRMAYLGAPRCEPRPDWPGWKPEPRHCQENYYRAVLAGLERFDAVAYDALGHQNTADSPVWDTVIDYTSDNWLVGTESSPPRDQEYLIDDVDIVWVAERAMLYREQRPERYFTVEELQDRGLAVIVSVNHPPRDFKGDVDRWRYERVLHRLQDGRVDAVATNLAGLIDAGYAMGPIKAAAMRN